MKTSELIDRANIISEFHRIEGREVTAAIIDILEARLALADEIIGKIKSEIADAYVDSSLLPNSNRNIMDILAKWYF